jgi:hypothetical protein
MGARLMLDYGYGSDDEREEADRADTASETAFAVLHGYSLPHTMRPDTEPTDLPAPFSRDVPGVLGGLVAPGTHTNEEREAA